MSGNKSSSGHGSSQNMNIQGGNFSQVQIAQAGRDLTQTSQAGSEDSEVATTKDVSTLIEDLEQLLDASTLGADQKKKAVRYLQAAKEAVVEEQPDKQYVAVSLNQATKVLKDAGATVEAGTGLWQKAQPLITKILPWLGTAAGLLA